MPRNGSGTYSLPAGNPVVTGTTISSTVHNNTMNDLASEMTNSVDKDGQTVITGSLDFNGNKLILDADADTSITADTDDQLDFEIGGSDVMVATPSSLTHTGTFNPSGDTSAGDTAALGYTATEGVILTGQGSTNDITLKNDADATVMSVPTGTTTVNFAGDVAVPTGTTNANFAGNISSLGIDDNASVEAIDLTDALVTVTPNMVIDNSNPILTLLTTSADNDTRAEFLENQGGAGDLGGFVMYDGSANDFLIGTVLNGADTTSITIPRDGSGNIEIGNGIYIGGTAAANLLDDYEEGTWTPVLSDGTNNATSSVNTARYTKIGNKVFIQGRLTTSSLGSVTGSVRITGLPFTSANVSQLFGGIYALLGSGLAITAGQNINGYVQTNNSYIVLTLWDTTDGVTNMQHTEWTADGSIMFVGSYQV